MKILITGCAGFIGSHVTEHLLEEGHYVTGIDNFDPFYPRSTKENNIREFLTNQDFCFIEGDITDYAFVNDLGGCFDVVIHLAAKAGVRPSIENPLPYLLTNINGTHHILEWMVRKKISKLVFASSSSVYGNNQKTPFSESDLVDHPISPYAATKKSCELINYTYHHLYNIDILNLRFFTVYGPRQRPDLAIHKFVKAILKNEPVTMYGSGDTARDYTFIRDTVNGVMGALDYVMNNGNVYEIVNLGNNHPVKLSELVHSVYNVLGKNPDIKRLPMQPGDVDITYADISKAQKLFGYDPKTTMEEGLKVFVDWYKKNSF
ncbi:MAG: GDP-mannose 4,6-dehydratase [Bacteroidetes bacterium]|nr:GDP-mannose 4,6-dehydratase [Bacteroidota bacterium]